MNNEHERFLLKANNISVQFLSENEIVTAVDNISFHIAGGQTLAIVGESGSGKTMTALSIMRIIPEGVDVRLEGEVFLEHAPMHTLSEKAIRQIRGGIIGIIFQEPMTSLNPIMSVGKQVYETVREHRPVSRSRAWSIVDSLFVEVGIAHIPDIRQRYPHGLSGGQQQRVMIAIALAGDPRLLIADEPTTALDVTVQSQILQLLTSLQEKRGMAMLFITHDLGVVSHIAHDIAIMRKGRIVEMGPTNKVLTQPQDPYTQSLLACRPPLHYQVERLVTLNEAGNGRIKTTPQAYAEHPKEGQILAIEDLSVVYPGKGWFSESVVAVDNVSLSLELGKTLGIVGESGSGKSSLAKAIIGLAPVTDGRVLFHGEELEVRTHLSPEKYRQIQYIFQDSYGALNPRHNVARLISEPLDIHRMAPGAERVPTLERLLDEVGLERRHLDRYPQELSGGQRQRVNIARALALNPELLICDEIVSALDVSVQAHILNLLKDIQERHHLSLLFISHDLAVVRFMADHVAVMLNGCIVELDETDVIIDSPSNRYTQDLIAAVREIEPVEFAPRVEFAPVGV